MSAGRDSAVCPECGAPEPRGARWCGSCGATLPVAGPSSATAAGSDPPSEHRQRRVRLGGAVVLVLALAGTVLLRAADPPSAPPDEEVLATVSNAGIDGARTRQAGPAPLSPPGGVVWRASVADEEVRPVGAAVRTTLDTPSGPIAVVVSSGPAGAPGGGAVTGPEVAVHDLASGEVRWLTSFPAGRPPGGTDVAAGLAAHWSLTHATLLDVVENRHLWTVPERVVGDAAVTPAGLVVGHAQDDATVAVSLLLRRQHGVRAWTWVPQDVSSGTRVHRVLATDTHALVLTGGNVITEVTALDLATGEPVWERAVRGGGFPAPAPVLDGQTLLLDDANGLVLLDADSGQARVLEVDRVVAAALVGDLVVTYDGAATIRALHRDGTVAWEQPAEPAPVFAIRAAHGRVIVEGDRGYAVLDGDDGTALVQGSVPIGAAPPLPVAGGDLLAVVEGDDGVTLERRPPGSGEPRWAAPTLQRPAAELVAADGLVLTDTSNALVALDATSGSEAWRTALPSRPFGAAPRAPVVAEQHVAVVTAGQGPNDRAELRSLDLTTGTSRWRAWLAPRSAPITDAIPHNGAVIVPIGDELASHDAVSGEQRSALTLPADLIGVASNDRTTVAVTEPAGPGVVLLPRASVRTTELALPACTPPLLVGQLGFVATWDGRVVAFDAATGELRWEARVDGTACRDLARAGPDRVLATVGDRDLLWLDLATGERRASATLPAPAVGSPVTLGEQALVSLLDGTLVASSPGAAAPDWRTDLQATPAGPPLVLGDTVYVRTTAGEVVALR